MPNITLPPKNIKLVPETAPIPQALKPTAIPEALHPGYVVNPDNHGVIYDLSPVKQKELKQMIGDIEDGELIYFGDIVANPKPDWLKE